MPSHAAHQSTLDPARQREFAVDVARQLQQRGFTALWAGGCVRDDLLGTLPADYDVATSARPEQVRDVFGQRRTLEIGAAFGVIVVLGPPGAGQIDVATFRQDAGYSDGRRPDSVEFSSPEADARRRDFTINGLFYDPVTSQVIDYVGGRADLERGVVRAIGNAHERIAEDKLRMLRAVRFAARLNFVLEADTFDAVRQRADQITAVSAERIAAEMRGMLVHPRRAAALQLLSDALLLPQVLPELAQLAASTESQQKLSTWQHTLVTLGRLEAPRFPLALAALLHLAPGNDLADKVSLRWKLSNVERERTTWLLRQLGEVEHLPEQPWSRQQPLLIEPGIHELLTLFAASAVAEGRATSAVDRLTASLALPPEVLNPPPLLTGQDLLVQQIPRGRMFAVLLQRVRDAQLDQKIADKPAALAMVNQLLADWSRDASAQH